MCAFAVFRLAKWMVYKAGSPWFLPYLDGKIYTVDGTRLFHKALENTLWEFVELSHVDGVLGPRGWAESSIYVFLHYTHILFNTLVFLDQT